MVKIFVYSWQPPIWAVFTKFIAVCPEKWKKM